MNSRLHALAGLIVVIAVLAISCTHGAGNTGSVVDPSIQEPDSERSAVEMQAGHNLWGYFIVYVDPEENKIEMVPLRQVVDHWNVLGFLEQGPCENCVEIDGFAVSPDLTLLLDLRITHPFPIANLTGFDVRGILLFEGTHLFPVSGLNVPDAGSGDCELVNTDGFTTLYNTGTIGSGPGGFQGYIDGRLATTEVPNAGLNGFRRHVSDDVANTRNAFYAGDEITVTYEIDPPDGKFVFGYAVDASWTPPSTKPVTDPMTDFPPEANCAEPWKIKVVDTPVGDGLTVLGGQTVLTIRVDDYQGRTSHAAPVIECPELFAGSLPATFTVEGTGFSRWEVTVENENLPAAGEYKCLVSVEDNENDPVGKPWLDLTAYQIYNLEVMNGCTYNEPPVADAHVAPDPPVIFPGEEVCFSDASTDPDGSGDIVLYQWDFSYDPVDGFQVESVEENPWHEFPEEGLFSVQLRVTDACGDSDMLDAPIVVQVAASGWARTWGGGNYDYGYGVAADHSGNVYVTGEFTGSYDFDPGPAVDWHESLGETDIFVCKYDSTGAFQWARTWGGIEYDAGLRVAVDSSGDVYTTGYFSGTVDFDPGPGVDNQVSNGGTWYGDVFVSKLDPTGEYQWSGIWGGERDDAGYGIAIDTAGNIYVTGNFWGTVDFDPGPGVDEQSPVMNDGVFLSKLASDGTYQYALTWGGTYSDWGFGVAVDGNDDVYVTGMYGMTADFDPGTGVEEHTSISWWDVFLSKFNSSGIFQWVRTWGGDEWEQGTAITVDGSNNVYVTGFFWVPVDFDPGTGTDVHDTNGSRDVFVSKFDSAGTYQWAATWGGTDWDESYGIGADDYGNVHVTGSFTGTGDFDPGVGTEEHLSAGGEDAFVSRLYPDGSLDWVRTWGGAGNDSGSDVTVCSADNVFVTGTFRDTAVDFDPGVGTDEHDSNGETDLFLLKLLTNGWWKW